MMGNACNRFCDISDTEVNSSTSVQELSTSYNREKCYHLEVEKTMRISTKIKTKIPFQKKTIVAEEVDKQYKLDKLKKQLEQEGTELAKKIGPTILGTALQNKNIDSEQKVMKSAGDLLVDVMAEGAKKFEKEAGRPMTYSEMREIWG